MNAYERLNKVFAEPQRAFSPAPIWWWSGDPLDIDRMRWQMDRFAEGGVYNLVILNLAPTGPLYGSDSDDPPFFSERWWEIFDQVCAYAEKKGMSIWFYDQIGFSGANIQGDIVRGRPEFAGRSLESAHVEGEGLLELACPSNGEPLAAGAVKIDEEGKPVGPVVPVPVEGGAARIAVEGRHRLRLVYSVKRGFDYFNPEACRALLERIHGAYEKRAGKHFGKSIVGSFQDELPSMPTWSADFSRRFAERWGYAIEPHLVGLWEQDDEESRKVRVHYHRLRAELAEEAFFKPLFEWHERHGLICGFDQQGPSRAGEPVGTVRQYADYLLTHRWYQAPGSDHHGEAKVHSSLAHLYGRPRVWIEAFHSSGWGGTLEETFDWLLPWLRAGANLYDPHAVYYSTRGGWWEWAPPSTCWRQPYWRHYKQFADAVTRLCAVLSEGVHVADIGILFPTATVQAGMTPDGPTKAAERAHSAYIELVGVMYWHRPKPGVLDRDARDFDVLDDDSVKRGEVKGGELVIGEERFKVIVTPACAVLDAGVARTLLRFAREGGIWIAVGTLPQEVVGEDGAALAAEIAQAHRRGRVKLIENPSDLPAALAGHPRLVDAPVPTLLKRVGDAHVLFVPAAFPCATVQHNPPGRLHYYEFDPKAYARSMRISVQGVSGRPELWDVLSGERRPLEVVYENGRAHVEVTFDFGPAALVVWPGESPAAGAPAQAGAELSGTSREGTDRGATDRGSAARGGANEARAGSAGAAEAGKQEADVYEFPEVWTAEVRSTLDNRYGDFDKPDYDGCVPVQTWFFEHRLVQAVGAPAGPHGAPSPARPQPEAPGENEGGWRRVQATFGAYGRWIGPAPVEELPPPDELPGELSGKRPDGSPAGDPAGASGAGAGGSRPWRDAVYSLSRGIPRDPLHHRSLGPKAHVPEEFCRFGRVQRGEAVQFCTRVRLEREPGEPLCLALAAPAAKFIWVNGEPVEAADDGYLALVPVRLKAGDNVFVWRLVAESDIQDLRSYWALVKRPEAFARPEWITAQDPPQRDSTLRFTVCCDVPFEPVSAKLQLGAGAPARILVNGVEVGRQGGFDPYYVMERVQPYETNALRRGSNEIAVEVEDLGRRVAIMFDALVKGPQGEELSVVSGRDWQVARDGGPARPVGLRREQLRDPAWSHLWRRPHPLPLAMWIEDKEAPDVVVPVTPDAFVPQGRLEEFRWTLPPGAVRAWIPVAGEIELWVDGEEVPVRQVEARALEGGPVYEAGLPRPEGLRRVAVLRVKPRDGRTGGALFTGPVRYECKKGAIALGDWGEQGLDAFSGAVLYAATVNLPAPPPKGRLILDLGAVRGTAEVRVNGAPAGVRVLSPYRFDVTKAVSAGENRFEVLVCNTLGPYLNAASPTPFVFQGQERSGVFGPVRLYAESATR